MLPWVIIVTKVKMAQADAWTFYSVIFGGALVFHSFNVGFVGGYDSEPGKFYTTMIFCMGKEILQRLMPILRTGKLSYI